MIGGTLRMSVWKMAVIYCQYKKVNGGVAIEIFGRTPEGESVTALYHGFKPYFHVVEPDERVITYLKNDPGVTDLTGRKLWHKGQIKECTRVQLVYPFEVPAYRNELRKQGFEILAADIPFVHRFFYDLDLGSFLEVEGRVADKSQYTTDLTVEVREIRSIEPFKIRLKVLSFDIENSIKTGELFMIGYSVGWLQLDENGIRDGAIVPDEEEIIERERRERFILKEFQDLIAKEDPDILTGYNIDGYDIPHMLKRMEDNSVTSLDLGRDLSPIEKMGYRSWRVRGRIVLDAWWEAKQAFRPKKESLEAVSNLLLGESKDDIDTAIIEEEWENRKDDVITYCKKDAMLALRILDRTQSVKRGLALSYVSKLPLLDILNGTTSVLIDSIMIREADRRDIGIPLTKHEKKTGKIAGAYVHAIKPGLYNWLVVLDFRSMYPSLMIEHNICFLTLTDDPSEGEPSPVEGVYFKPPEKVRGLVPEILKNLMEERERAKKGMKEASDEDEKDYYDSLQGALKVLMNSFYGVFASYFYRFTDRSIGSSITAYARESIMGIINTLDEEGHEVIYSDTDSIFIKSPEENLEGTLKFGGGLSKRFSSDTSVLEFEKVFRSFFTHGKKKRYVGKTAWPKEDLIVRGYETRRTDAFDLQSEALKEMFELILSGDKKGALDYARDVISRCRSGDVDTESLVISRSIQEVDEDKIRRTYKNPDSMANVQALRKSRDLGIEMVPGMKISWVVTDAGRQPQRVEPFVDGRDFKHAPDYGYYAERLASTLSRLTEVFGVGEKELLTGVQQASLFDDFESDSHQENVTVESHDDGKEKDNDDDSAENSTLDKWM